MDYKTMVQIVSLSVKSFYKQLEDVAKKLNEHKHINVSLNLVIMFSNIFSRVLLGYPITNWKLG